MRLLIRGLLGIVILFSVLASGHADENQKRVTVVLLPLSVERAGSFMYLGDAVRPMLVTRLTAKDGIVVVTPTLSAGQLEKISEQLRSGQSSDVARQLQADWVADGSIAANGDGMRIALELFPRKEGAAPLVVSADAARADGVLAAVDEITAIVAVQVGAALPAEPDTEPGDKPTPATTEGMTAFQTPHPERMFKKGVYSGTTVFGDAEDRFQSRGVRRSAALPIVTESMAIGDLDGDTVNDLVVASRSQLRIFHFTDDRFQQVAAFDFPSTIKIHVVTIGDTDGTGKPRLFVSANKGMAAASAVLSWDGSERLQLLQSDLDWFVRAIKWPGEGERLIGQQVAGKGAEQYLAKGVFGLAMDHMTGRVVPQDQLLLPNGTNLFDFVVADFNGDGRNETAIIDSKQQLLLYDAALSLVWVSSAHYGGSLGYFGPPLIREEENALAKNSDQQDLRTLNYIPGRLDVKDVTGDGVPELVVVSNEVDMISRYLPNIRAYDGGSVACLGWRGTGLVELWRTSHITGYVADYVFERGTDADATDAGVLSRLYVAQLPERGLWRRFLPWGDATRILAYEMRVAIK